MTKENELQLQDLTDVEWDLIRDLIPMAGSKTEQSAMRACVNGILWRMRTGEPWTRVPQEYGRHRLVYERFAEWRRSGVWQKVTETLAHARPRKGRRLSD